MRTITVTEFRRRTAEYIRLVEGGETIAVTVRGRVLGQIEPVRDQGDGTAPSAEA
jgi:prevent-host-death family protein